MSAQVRYRGLTTLGSAHLKPITEPILWKTCPARSRLRPPGLKSRKTTDRMLPAIAAAITQSADISVTKLHTL